MKEGVDPSQGLAGPPSADWLVAAGGQNTAERRARHVCGLGGRRGGGLPGEAEPPEHHVRFGVSATVADPGQETTLLAPTAVALLPEAP